MDFKQPAFMMPSKQYDNTLIYHNKTIEFAHKTHFKDILVRSYMQIINSYNRLKYYSALRTGYQQLNPAAKSSFLKVPQHAIEPFLYYIQAPL